MAGCSQNIFLSESMAGLSVVARGFEGSFSEKTPATSTKPSYNDCDYSILHKVFRILTNFHVGTFSKFCHCRLP